MWHVNIFSNKTLRDLLVVIVEKIQLFVLFFRKTVDISPKGDYYYTIVILHVHFARVAKGCRGIPRQKKYSKWRIK
jgi:hypothetical protein